MERTPIYHMVAAGVYFQCYRLCKLNGIPVPPYMEPTLEKSAQFIMSLVKPDLSTPMIGDADRDDLTTPPLRYLAVRGYEPDIRPLRFERDACVLPYMVRGNGPRGLPVYGHGGQGGHTPCTA